MGRWEVHVCVGVLVGGRTKNSHIPWIIIDNAPKWKNKPSNIRLLFAALVISAKIISFLKEVSSLRRGKTGQ